MTDIKDMTETYNSEETMLQDMLAEIQTLNKIAVLKEDDFVIRSILRGKSRNAILEELKKKYPNEKITKYDINKFLLLYRDVLEMQKVDIEKSYVRRLIKSKEGLNNQLIDLAISAKEMSERYDKQKDNSNAVGALRTAADIFMKFAKVEGLANDMPEVNINMQMDKVVAEVTGKSSAFKDAVMKVINDEPEPETIEAEYKDG